MKKILLFMTILLCSLAVLSGNAKAAQIQDDYQYEILNEAEKSAAITRVNNAEGIVKIPEKIDGYTVVQVSTMEGNAYDFYYDMSEEHQLFPGETADKVTQVELPDTIHTIGVQAFQGCHNMTMINIPKKLRYIGAYAMHKCSKIKSVTLPKTLKGIGWGAFAKCTSLEKAVFKTNSARIGASAFSTGDFPYTKDKGSLKKISLPYTYKGEIMDDAFSGYIGKSFTWRNFTADNGAFFDRVTTLRKITFPKKLKKIDIPRDCFGYSAKYLKLVIPDGVKSVYVGQHHQNNIKSITIRGEKTLLEGDYGMGIGDKHRMISAETIKCKKKSVTWKKAKKYICPNFKKGFKEKGEYEDDIMYTEKNIYTKKIKLISL